MALTRRMLTAMGIEADKIDEIIAAHTESIEALKAQRDEYKADADKYSAVSAELEGLKKKTEADGTFEQKYNDLVAEREEADKKATAKYEKLKGEFDKFKADAETQQTVARKKTAYRDILQSIGVSPKRLDAVLRLANLDSVQFDENGALANEDDLKKTAAEEWSDYIVTESQLGAETEKPPQSNGGKMSKEDILKIKDTSQRQKAIAENHELFGF